jgi:hypothetical protein
MVFNDMIPEYGEESPLLLMAQWQMQDQCAIRLQRPAEDLKHTEVILNVLQNVDADYRVVRTAQRLKRRQITLFECHRSEMLSGSHKLRSSHHVWVNINAPQAVVGITRSQPEQHQRATTACI